MLIYLNRGYIAQINENILVETLLRQEEFKKCCRNVIFILSNKPKYEKADIYLYIFPLYKLWNERTNLLSGRFNYKLLF